MSVPFDLRPAVRAVSAVVQQTSDEHLDAPTPCPSWQVSDLLVHLLGLSVAFREAGRKNLGEFTSSAPDPTADSLPDDWREVIPARLDELAQTWQDPEAWSGFTQAGGVDLPAPVAGQVALNEVLVHGWDLARATGAPYQPDTDSLNGSLQMLEATGDQMRGEIFGPTVSVPDDAPLLNRVIGLSGRNPSWTPS